LVGQFLILACIIDLRARPSKACCTSRKTKAHIFLTSSLSGILLIILWHCCALEWLSRKPNGHGGISLLSGTASIVLLRSGLSNTLAIMGRRPMGLYDVTSVGGFPGWDIMKI
jgi:hypothetical protein